MWYNDVSKFSTATTTLQHSFSSVPWLAWRARCRPCFPIRPPTPCKCGPAFIIASLRRSSDKQCWVRSLQHSRRWSILYCSRSRTLAPLVSKWMVMELAVCPLFLLICVFVPNWREVLAGYVRTTISTTLLGRRLWHPSMLFVSVQLHWSRRAETSRTYISRQSRRRLCDQDHTALVVLLESTATRRGWDINIVCAELPTTAAQHALAASTTILLNVHGNGLTHLLTMALPSGAPLSRSSTPWDSHTTTNG
jgi:hypothetical protein